MSVQLFDLSEKVALVTGGNSGLGLASRASDYVTGQIIFVDGGFTAKV
jgi:NAD(P)-dependent dehydrogenase (short-subunit alcohol dehydrogenase family)